jgi:hypothetical protein
MTIMDNNCGALAAMAKQIKAISDRDGLDVRYGPLTGPEWLPSAGASICAIPMTVSWVNRNCARSSCGGSSASTYRSLSREAASWRKTRYSLVSLSEDDTEHAEGVE